MNIDIPAIIDFIVVTVIFKYIVVHWIAEKCMGVFKWAMIRSKDEAIAWYHYSEGAMGHGHTARTPHLCEDGFCKQLKDK